MSANQERRSERGGLEALTSETSPGFSSSTRQLHILSSVLSLLMCSHLKAPSWDSRLLQNHFICRRHSVLERRDCLMCLTIITSKCGRFAAFAGFLFFTQQLLQSDRLSLLPLDLYFDDLSLFVLSSSLPSFMWKVLPKFLEGILASRLPSLALSLCFCCFFLFFRSQFLSLVCIFNCVPFCRSTACPIGT